MQLLPLTIPMSSSPHRSACALSLAVLVLPGCSTRSPFDDLLEDDTSTLVSQLDDYEYRSSGRPQGPPSPHLTIPDDADVEHFVALALERNPAIKAADERVRRLAERVPQVTSLDDPMLQVAPFGEMAETAAGQVGLMTGVSQRLPLPQKLERRGRIAGQDVAEAMEVLHQVQIDVVADTRQAWWSYYYTSRAIDVTERNRDLLSQFKDVAEAKFRAGTASQQDVLRASVELSNLENELIAFRQRQTSARAMLNRLVDRPVNAPIPQPRVATLDEIELDLEALLLYAAVANPTIQRVKERIEGFNQRYELARLNRWPDLTVSFNYNLVESEGLSAIANGDDQWWVGFGINLPIWTERLDAAEREALRGRLEGIAQLDDEQNRVAFRVQDAFAKVESQQQQVILFRDVIVPQAQQTVDASLSSYRAGTVDFLTLIDNWRKLLVFQLMYHQTLTQLEQSFAELQRAIGDDADRRPSTPPDSSVSEPRRHDDQSTGDDEGSP